MSLCFCAIPDGKPLRTFPGIALSLYFAQFRTENRYALFLELLWQANLIFALARPMHFFDRGPEDNHDQSPVRRLSGQHAGA
ncbi:MAG: hypothetical protein EOS36_08275 [Mesorhizobium sp.]|nr:MAG: hypothetical protein EOS36_08275 [Mesorhizobium sp.]RWE47538.1 MAG: hypothetical protein EOS79_10780 [Mesorhizobium sp.]